MSRAWNGLIAFAGATTDQLWEFPLFVCLWAFLFRRHEARPFDLFDLGTLVVAVWLQSVLVLRIIRRAERPFDHWRRIPKGTTTPTASWGHLVWAAAWFTVAFAFVRSGSAVLESFGAALFICVGFLSALRLAMRVLRR